MRRSPQTRRFILIFGLLICLLAAASRSSFPHNQSAKQFLEKEILRDKLDAQLAPEQTNALINNEVNMRWSAAGVQQVKPILFDYGVFEGKYYITEDWMFDGEVVSPKKLSGNSIFNFRNIDNGNVTRIKISGITHDMVCNGAFKIKGPIISCALDEEKTIKVDYAEIYSSKTEHGNLLHADNFSPISFFDFDSDNVSEIIISAAGQGTRHHDLHYVFDTIDIDYFSSLPTMANQIAAVPHLSLSYYFRFNAEKNVLFEIAPNSSCSYVANVYRFKNYKYMPANRVREQC